MSTVTLAPHVTAPRRPAARRTTSGAGQVRLTRRGRLVVFLLALGAVIAAALWLAAGSAASGDAGAPAEVDIVTVAPGDTLWDIASDAAASAGGSTDVRDMMQRIEQLNALDGGTVYVGQDLRVPAAD